MVEGDVVVTALRMEIPLKESPTATIAVIRGQALHTERDIRGITPPLDGLPLNDPTGFTPELFDVDRNRVQRIEVLRRRRVPAPDSLSVNASGLAIRRPSASQSRLSPSVRSWLKSGAVMTSVRRGLSFAAYLSLR
jgi:hypothetical protein